MSTELIINASLPEVRVALLQDQEIIEVLIERSELKGIVGNIYKGRVTRVLPGMQAAFVDIGLEKAAFLYVDDVYHHPMSPVGDESVDESSRSADESESLGAPSGIIQPVKVIQPRILAKSVAPVSNSETSDGSSAESEMSEGVSSDENMAHVSGGEEGAAPLASEADAHEFIQDIQDEDNSSLQDRFENEPSVMSDELSDDSHSDDSHDDEFTPDASSHEASLDKTNEASLDETPTDDTDEDEVSPENASEATEISGGVEAEGSSEVETETTSVGNAVEGGKISAPITDAKGRRGFRGRRGGRGTGRRGAYLKPKSGVRSSSANEAESAAVDAKDWDIVPESLAYAADQTSEMHQGEERYEGIGNRPDSEPQQLTNTPVVKSQPTRKKELRMQRGSDRRVRSKTSGRPFRPVQIQDLLKEGQEVLVQIAKDPIATKGARLTCHISLPGRHLVCMPTIDHVGVSRRIERDDERRRLRDFVEKNRPNGVGFIVRTASGKQQSAEKRIKQDIDYLTELWNEIREKAATSSAPGLIYEDLNAILKPIRDWVTEDVDKIIVDSRYHHGEIVRFVSKFMPALRSKVELYHGDIPVFDAYNISTELSRALERKVWLKSGGYIVIDQAEALVAIDVNTGRYVGKRNLEDTIIKTNLEAVKEIAYQLRLRNCGGIIILDFIDMEKEENRQRVYRALEEELKKDRSRPTIQKISDLGLVEMTRKRTVDTMIRVLGETCAHCEGRGFVKSKLTVAYEILRDLEREGLERDVDKLLIQAHPDVIETLAVDEKETLDSLERRYGKNIYLQGVEGFHPEQFEISSDKKVRKAREYERHRDEKLSQRKEDPRADRSDPERGSVDRGEADTESPIRQSKSAQKRTPRIMPRVIPLASTQNSDFASAQVGEGESSQNPSENRTVINAVRHNDSEASETAENGLLNKEDGSITSEMPVLGDDDDFSEEDRLAFLRAQAAQDAALASLSAGATPALTSRGGRAGQAHGAGHAARHTGGAGRGGFASNTAGKKNVGKRGASGGRPNRKGKPQPYGRGGQWGRDKTPEQAAAFSYREEARAAVEGGPRADAPSTPVVVAPISAPKKTESFDGSDA